MSHPYVSEDHEGKPWFEWIVAAVVIVATVLAVAGYTKALFRIGQIQQQSTPQSYLEHTI